MTDKTKRNIEHELRVLAIDPDQLLKKFEKLGAKKVGDFFYRRYIFDVIPPATGHWVRLRTDGTKTTLTVKEIRDESVDGTQEWETTVDDFAATLVMLEKMGLSSKSYQETKRTQYELDDVELSIDWWPQIPPFLEIEAKNEEKITTCALRLGFKTHDLIALNPLAIYSHYDLDISAEKELRF